jgi:ABC-2 type transport system ATP-binding protein
MAGLRGREKSLAKELAGGWKQRLALGCAILHEPKILFLDEPTGGVDPVSRRQFWELINGLSESGTTVLVTTHYLDEAEYCNTILLIHAGKLIASGSPLELKTKYSQNPMLEVECDKVIEALDILQREKWVIETSVFGTYIHLSVEDGEKGRILVRKILGERNIIVKRVDGIVPSLEDVFIHLIEKRSKEFD